MKKPTGFGHSCSRCAAACGAGPGLTGRSPAAWPAPPHLPQARVLLARAALPDIHSHELTVLRQDDRGRGGFNWLIHARGAHCCLALRHGSVPAQPRAGPWRLADGTDPQIHKAGHGSTGMGARGIAHAAAAARLAAQQARGVSRWPPGIRGGTPPAGCPHPWCRATGSGRQRARWHSSWRTARSGCCRTASRSWTGPARGQWKNKATLVGNAQPLESLGGKDPRRGVEKWKHKPALLSSSRASR